MEKPHQHRGGVLVLPHKNKLSLSFIHPLLPLVSSASPSSLCAPKPPCHLFLLQYFCFCSFTSVTAVLLNGPPSYNIVYFLIPLPLLVSIRRFRDWTQANILGVQIHQANIGHSVKSGIGKSMSSASYIIPYHYSLLGSPLSDASLAANLPGVWYDRCEAVWLISYFLYDWSRLSQISVGSPSPESTAIRHFWPETTKMWMNVCILLLLYHYYYCCSLSYYYYYYD